MATYYDALNDFHKLNEQEPLASSAQLVYLHLLHLNNRHGNSGHVQISDRELEHRTRLNKNTITEAKRILKNHGLVDFKTDRSKPRTGTTYTLSLFSEKVGQTLGQNPGQTVGQTVGQTYKYISNNKSLSEDLRLKTKDNTSFIQSAGARETSELDNLLEYWEETIKGGRLSFEHQSLLSALLAEKGLEWLKEAMKEASDINTNPHGLSAKLLFGVIERKANPKPKANPLSQKGGKKSERPARIDYGEEPDYSWIK